MGTENLIYEHFLTPSIEYHHCIAFISFNKWDFKHCIFRNFRFRIKYGWLIWDIQIVNYSVLVT